MPLSKKIKKLRELAGYSQTEVAEILNISRQSISKWENGHTYPDIDNLIELSKIYNTSIDDLLNEADEIIVKTNVTETDTIDSSSNSNNNKPSPEEKDEGLILLTIAAVSCLLFPLGYILVLIIAIRNKRTNSLYKFIYIVCICSLLLNVFDTYRFIGNYFNWGETVVEKVK